ncbi:hypothetical protein AYL99_11875 [Fonsecaea erecta]|uniref:Uncharacterized protein n=1 Tax=Fonsecaea erecta TaxID=1367422 RepID=A0A178Z3S7_9EURO|nr:hypothetical protein AYL99_11875 [Fonsecaea erecta]OAP53853.1 hypothetical protein AYL99_11875 [Fonsecaea erecta]
MNSRSDNPLEAGAPGQAASSLSSSDGDTADGDTACPSQPSPPNIPKSLTLPTSTHETLDSVPTITPPQANDMSTQHTVLLNQADRVRADLRAYLTGKFIEFADKPREYILPTSDFHGLLENDDFESDRKQAGVKFSYNSHTSTLTLFTIQGARYTFIIQWLTTIALSKLNPSIVGKLYLVGSGDEVFESEWKWSTKQPDLAIAWNDNGPGYELHTVIEVGVAQPYNSLLDVRDMYLKGTSTVSRFVLVNITTDPEYRSPKGFNIDELDNIRKEDFQLDSNQGPLWYKGVQWIGKSTLLWEVWERGSNNGKPKRVFSVTIDPEDNNTELPFFEIPATIATGTNTVVITPTDINTLFADRFKHLIVQEAYTRMLRYVKNVKESRQYTADLARRKDEVDEKRSKANKERTERCRIRSERREKAADLEE